MNQSSQIKTKDQNGGQQISHSSSRPSISLCMIVKNEEEFLNNCLKSICDFVDEIIIVDTGSEDNTVAIAQKYTDRVYHHPWENSFSKARNQVLKYASCDWVFQIDADEELVEGGGEKLHEAVRSAGEADIIYIMILSSYSKGTKTTSHNVERLFKNNGIIHYEGAVHNRIIGGTRPLFSSIQLIHHGYDVDNEKFEAKFKRTTELLKQEISNGPQNPLNHHYLGVSYLSMKMDSEAAKESELAISLADSQGNHNPIYLWAHFNASMANYRLGNLKKAEELALKSYRISDNHLDSFYMLTVIKAEKNDWRNVVFFGERYLSLLDQYETDPGKANIQVNNTIQEKDLILSLIGHAQYFLKDREQMNNYYVKALDCSDDKSRISLRIGAFHLDRSEDMELAKYYIDRALEFSPDDLEFRYVLAKFHNKTGSPADEKQCLEWLFSKGCRDEVVLKKLIELCLIFNDLDLAFTATDEAIKEHDDIWYYLQKKAEIYRSRDEPANAIECYTRILEKKPESGSIWNELGNVCNEMGDLGNAEAFFQKAVSLMEDKTVPLIKLCEIYISENSLEDIINILSRLITSLGIQISSTIDNLDDLFSALKKVSSTLGANPEYSHHSHKLVYLFESGYAHLLSGKQSSI